MTEHPADRFFKYVDQTGECHLWTGSVLPQGHGRFGLGRNQSPVAAHRFAYEIANGPIPPKHVVLQTCRNPVCVNPDHLIACSYSDMQKKHGLGGSGGRTHCPKGHAFNGDNVSTDNRGKRICRACRSERSARYYLRKKGRL